MLDKKSLESFGKKWVKYIKEEAKKDALKSTFIPRSPDFYKSFSYKVEGEKVAIYSTWEWLDIITKGTRGPYKMAWLTQAQGVNIVPLRQQDGTVAFRTAPLTTANAWIHPKIAKHTFINRAYDRALGEHLEGVLEEALNNGTKRKR